MEKERAYHLVMESLESLRSSDMLDRDVVLNNETVLIGAGSPLDSIGFVTFVTDLEEKISNETKKDIYLVLDKIKEFNVNKPQLSVNALTNYIMQLGKGEQD